jgi:hypothetical protein
MDLDEETIPAPPDCSYRCYEDPYNTLKNMTLKTVMVFDLSALYHMGQL